MVWCFVVGCCWCDLAVGLRVLCLCCWVMMRLYGVDCYCLACDCLGLLFVLCLLDVLLFAFCFGWFVTSCLVVSC